MEHEYLSFEDEKCVKILLKGDVLAFPTETVFGLGAIYDSKNAFDKLVNLKNRSPEKPFTVMVSNKNDIYKFAEVDEKTQRVIDKFLPGEITLLLPSKKTYPWVSLNQKTIGIRFSALKEVSDLISRVGKPLLVTSTNRSGKPALNTYDEVYEEFKNDSLPIVKLENYQKSNLPSTIVLIDKDSISLIRQGAIPFKEIKSCWEGIL